MAIFQLLFLAPPSEEPSASSQRPSSPQKPVKKRKRVGNSKKKTSVIQPGKRKIQEEPDDEQNTRSTPANVQTKDAQVATIPKKIAPRKRPRGQVRSDALAQTFTEDEIRQIDATVEKAKGLLSTQTPAPLLNPPRSKAGNQVPTQVRLPSSHIRKRPGTNHASSNSR